MLLIVFLDEDNRVLSLCHVEVFAGTVHTERVGFKSSCYLLVWQRIGVNRDEEVSLCLVCYFCSGMKWHEEVLLSRIYHSDIRAVSLHVSSESECCTQVDVFFL